MVPDKVEKFIYSSPDFRCTCFFNGWWLKACLAHDYNCADADAQQSVDMRREADKQLWCDVSMSGKTTLQKTVSPAIGALMYVFVMVYSKVVCRYRYYN